MGIPTTYWQKAISGNPVKTNTGAILNCGDSNLDINGQSLLENQTGQLKYGSRPGLAVTPTASGNLGTTKPLSGGRFCNIEKGNYIGKRYTSTIAGTQSTLLRSGAADVAGSRRGKNGYAGYRRLGLGNTWNYVTGAITKGGGAGAFVDASGVNGVLGFRADEASSLGVTDLVPGELVVFHNKLGGPTQLDYSARTNIG